MSVFDIGEKIKKFREIRGLSQSELGNILNVTNRAVSKWENGKSYPSIELLQPLAEALNVSVITLIGEIKEYKSNYIRREPKGMKSIKDVYTIDRGPSSSHTIGPKRAAEKFKAFTRSADKYKVILLGSLAKYARVFSIDKIIKSVLAPTETEIILDLETIDLPHPNTMIFSAYKNSEEISSKCIISIGGGSIEIVGDEPDENEYIYKLKSFEDISDFCKEKNIKLWEYVELTEGKEIWDYIALIWHKMQLSIKSGLETTGMLSGGLNVQRKARHLYKQHHIDESNETRENRLVCTYAFAVSEQNSECHEIVTAPTSCSAGVLPAVLKYVQEKKNIPDEKILHAIATAGIIGNLIKTNASVSSAMCGCQAEIGTACAMAAAALAEIYDLSIEQIEYAAEIAIEHNLGLTCDPIRGLVQIPCIERNAVAAMRAINAVNLSNFLSDTRKISFDLVVKTMYETGIDISRTYKETSEGGLAKLYS